MKYIDAEIEIIYFDTEDVITVSNPDPNPNPNPDSDPDTLPIF